MYMGRIQNCRHSLCRFAIQQPADGKILVVHSMWPYYIATIMLNGYIQCVQTGAGIPYAYICTYNFFKK